MTATATPTRDTTPSRDKPPSRRRRKRVQRRRWLRGSLVVVLLFLLLLMTISFASAAYTAGVVASAPTLAELPERSVGANTIVYAADGSKLGYIRSDKLRTPIPGSQMPTHAKRATIAVEDRRFYLHRGVDYQGALRAAWENLSAGGVVQGGSTLTMQLVRNIYISNERSMVRKIAEAKLASELEEKRDKQWILAEYLNNAPYGVGGDGQEIVGLEAAARNYFNKPARRLNLQESALLAGLPQAPSLYNPFLHPRAAKARRNQVLEAMVVDQSINRIEAESAKRTPISIERNTYYARRREAYFFDYVRTQLVARYGEQAVKMGGMQVYTTIEPRLQRSARASIRRELNQSGDPTGAVVAVDPRNGHIRAMASGQDYASSQFNLAAQGRRQPGSTFKTFALATALQRRVNPRATYYKSRPLNFRSKKWGRVKVKTYDSSYRGNINLLDATLRSDNSVFTQLTLDLGPANIRRTAKRMGITSPLQANLSLGLGGLDKGVSPLEMASAYGTLAAEGKQTPPSAIRRVVFASGGSERLDRQIRSKRALSVAAANSTTEILRANIERGTGKKARISCPAAGKTGTTDSYKDAWFVGYTPQLATAVWVGYAKGGRAMRNVHGIPVAGGTYPASIWRRFQSVANGKRCKSLRGPVLHRYKRFCRKYTSICGTSDRARSGGGGAPATGQPIVPGAPYPTGAPAQPPSQPYYPPTQNYGPSQPYYPPSGPSVPQAPQAPSAPTPKEPAVPKAPSAPAPTPAPDPTAPATP